MYDCIIIGAGVTGCAIARELSRYKVNACVIEREEDVCCGTSKANSAIIHAGYDAKPGTLKAEMNLLGNAMMDKIAEELDIPFKRNGSIVVCTKDQDPKDLDILLERGLENGVKGLRIAPREELIKLEPNISDDVTCGLIAPTAGIVCPFTMTIGYAENAFVNGVKFKLDTELRALEKTEGGFALTVLDRRTGKTSVIKAAAVVNAAGVYADVINNMVSENKLHITPRRGEYKLLDRAAGSHVSSTIFQLPTAMGKGVLVTPTIHGNLLVGPTAEDVDEKDALNTTASGLEYVSRVSAKSVKNLPLRQVITSFAGLRAHEDGDDFVIAEAEDAPGFFNAAGIESPGLSSAPAIGAAVAKLVAEKLELKEDPDFDPVRKGVLDPKKLTVKERNSLIKEKPAYGNIICRCEMITEGEIIDAIRRPLGARSLDGVKRRTRAGMGRCQAGFCTPKTLEILRRETGKSIENIGKNGIGSELIVGKPKDSWRDEQ